MKTLNTINDPEPRTQNSEPKTLIHPGDVPATYTDVAGLMEEFDYKPNTSHTEGIARFIKWYKSFYSVDEPLEK